MRYFAKQYNDGQWGTLIETIDQCKAVGGVDQYGPFKYIEFSPMTEHAHLTSLCANYREDAERWRAMVGCARVRVLGSAGIAAPKPDGYAHIGVELWTRHTAPSDPAAIEWLTKFADIAKTALQAEKEGKL